MNISDPETKKYWIDLLFVSIDESDVFLEFIKSTSEDIEIIVGDD